MAMDFFAAQDKARRRSLWLLLWFAMAVVCITLLIYVAVEVFLYCFTFFRLSSGSFQEFAWKQQTFIIVATVVLGTILWCTLSKIRKLSKGGGAFLAKELGGELVERKTSDLNEQRLINIVDEIAIASGIPPPAIYVLDRQRGINAFAAGNSQADAVIAVTRGSLEHLSRDELQGIIAHEFSHILNGDMRLNIRLIGVLNGILFMHIAGSKLVSSLPNPKEHSLRELAALYYFLVLVIWTIPFFVGAVGLVCAEAIKAGISRQREFLADAVAVQFTQNPEGIVGALLKIERFGSEIHHPFAEEASHMFFGSGASSSLFATHPSIKERIHRIMQVDLGPAPAVLSRYAADDNFPHDALGFVNSIGNPDKGNLDYSHILLTSIIPSEITHLLQAEEGVIAAILAPLLSQDKEPCDNQLNRICEQFGNSVANRSKWIAEWLHKNGAPCRLPLIDLALPPLKRLPETSRQALTKTADAVIECAGKTTLFQYVVRYLLGNMLTTQRSKQTSSANRADNLAQLIAMLARVGSKDEGEARQAFETAVSPLPHPLVWPDKVIVSAKTLDNTLATLARTKPEFRKTTIEACLRAIHFDQRVTANEAELLRAICQALECPVPPPAQYASVAIKPANNTAGAVV